MRNARCGKARAERSVSIDRRRLFSFARPPPFSASRNSRPASAAAFSNAHADSFASPQTKHPSRPLSSQETLSIWVERHVRPRAALLRVAGYEQRVSRGFGATRAAASPRTCRAPPGGSRGVRQKRLSAHIGRANCARAARLARNLRGLEPGRDRERNPPRPYRLPGPARNRLCLASFLSFSSFASRSAALRSRTAQAGLFVLAASVELGANTGVHRVGDPRRARIAGSRAGPRP